MLSVAYFYMISSSCMKGDDELGAAIINDKNFIIVKGVLVKYKSNSPFAEVPYGVGSIGKEAFSYTDVQTVELPETVTRIDDNAFDHCQELYEINLPDGISYIGRDAFSYCWNLKSLGLPSNLQVIGSGAFANTGISEISIPNSVSVIESKTFEYCSALKKVDLPNELKSIGWRAFYYCKELTDLSFSTKIENIDSEAFQGCNVLTNRDGFIILDDKLAYYSGNERVVNIPEGVKHIASRVFEKKNRVRKVILPESLSSIGYCAFSECHNLRDINISTSVAVDDNAFSDCPKLADENGFIIINGVLFGYYDDSTRVMNEQRKEACYQEAVKQLGDYDGSNREQLERAIDLFEVIEGYKDSEIKLKEYYKKYWNLDI